MAEYIERGDAIDAVMKQYCASSDETEFALGNAAKEIKAIPATDIRPSRKGKWVFHQSADQCFCSECGAQMPGLYMAKTYCPGCGADMRRIEDANII